MNKTYHPQKHSQNVRQITAPLSLSFGVMRIASSVLIVTLLPGCAAQPHQPMATCSDDSVPDISVSRLSSRDGSTKYQLRSNENCALTYFHWLAQGPEPVPYCKSDLGKVWICATIVFGIDGVDGNFVELTHETRLPARASVSFQARDEGASEIGVRFWSYAKGQEVYVWNDIAK